MITALYRRYRPDTFQDVIGQDHVTAPLMAALRGDRVTHAYLFSGPRGCGKTTSARILARCLNCERFPADTPCGQCASCRDLATGGPGSLDVVEIDAASHNGVDDARDLRERAAFAPARDRYKIFILDEAHMVTAQGFNALLKLVEEPPAHVKFIFATTEPEKVIGTIRSRTHHYPFRLVAPDTLEAYLAHLCDAEDVRVGPGVFPLVTRAGGGSVRDTLSVMDQLIGGAIDSEVDYRRAVALLGYTDTTMLDACVDALAASDGAGVFRVVDRVVSSGHDPRRFVEDLLQRLRDLLVIALAGSEAGPALGSMPDDELARMEVQSRTIGAAGLSRAADVTAQALSQMVGATSPRLQLELLMARLLVSGRRAAAPGAPAGPPAQHPGGDGPQQAGGGRAMAAEIARRAAPTAAPPEPGQAQGGAPARAAEAAETASPAAQAAPPAAVGSAVSPGAGTASAASGAHAAAPPPSATPQGGVSPVDWDSPEQAPERPAQAGRSGGAGGAGPRPGSQPGSRGEPSANSTPSAGAVPSQSPQPPQTPSPSQTPQPPQPPGQASPAADAEMIRGRWEEVLEAAKRSRRATWALVGPNSQPGAINNGVFEVIFSGQGLVNAFENGGHGPVLSRALHQALGLRLEVHAVLAGPGGGPGGPSGGPGGSAGPGGGGPGGWPGGPGAAAPDGAGWPDGAGADAAGSAGQMGRGGPAVEGAPVAFAPQAPGGPVAPGDEAPGRPEPAAPRVRTPADAASPGPVDDGWGVIAVPGAQKVGRGATEEAGRGAAEQTATVPSGPSAGAAAADDGAPSSFSHPVPSTAESAGSASPDSARSAPVRGPADRGDLADPAPTDAQGERPLSSPATRAADSAPSAPSPAGPSARSAEAESSAEPGPAASEATASPPSSPDGAAPLESPGSPASPGAPSPEPPASPASPGPPGPDPVEATPLATVHRLHALPKLPGGAAPSSPSASTPTSQIEQLEQGERQERHEPREHHGLAPVSWDSPDTFSDGTPVPQEPPPEDEDEPEPGEPWAPADDSQDRVSAARAAARAAARGQAHAGPGAARSASFASLSVDDDVPSEDDEDAEEAGVVGLEVVKRLLGAKVLEEITVTQERR